MRASIRLIIYIPSAYRRQRKQLQLHITKQLEGDACCLQLINLCVWHMVLLERGSWKARPLDALAFVRPYCGHESWDVEANVQPRSGPVAL